MRYVCLSPLLPRASVIAVGCSAFGGRVGRRAAFQALDEAWDLGINVFDTARSYGYGESEHILGQFLRGRRERAIVCSKVGIRALRTSVPVRLAKAAARCAFAVAPTLRSRARPVLGARHASTQFTPAEIRTSLATSLAELGTDHVDLLLLHACPLEIVGRDEVFETLVDVRRSGQARAVGVSGDVEMAEAALAVRGDVVDVIQCPLDVTSLAAWPTRAARPDAGGRNIGRMAVRVFGGGRLARSAESLVDGGVTGLGAELRAKLSVDPAVRTAELLIRGVATSALADVLVLGMTTRAHVRQNVEALASTVFADEELALFGRWAASERSISVQEERTWV